MYKSWVTFSLFVLTLGFSLNAQVPANTIQNQLENAPPDPSFLYESRFIPGNAYEQKEIELPKKEITDSGSESTSETENFSLPKNIREELDKKIPQINLTQVIIVGGIILLFVFYRIRIKKRGQGK